MQHLIYTYPGRQIPAVNDVSFSLRKGSYTAITGSNGSGKSTLARLLCNLLDTDSGTITIQKDMRICMVFQSPKDQIVCGMVFRDTAFGPQNLNLQPGEVELRTIESLSITGMLDHADNPTLSLSLGQTQKTALSGIIALHPDILILDEAVSMLDPSSREDIFCFLDQWNKTGHTIIHITHDMDAICRASDVLVFDSGNILFSGTTAQFFTDAALCLQIAGNKLPVYDRTRLLTENGAGDKTHTVLAVQDISFSYGNNCVLDGIGFTLAAGSLTALTGISGSGKSTLLEICAGLLAPDTGRICSDSRPVLAQQNCDVALFEQFAADDVAFGPHNHEIAGEKLVTLVRNAMNMAAIPFSEYAERQTFMLSGGEKRRLSLAGIIALDAQVLLFDEPTAGLDGHARYGVMMMMRTLAEQGKTILFSTHRREEAAFANNELTLSNGKIKSAISLAVEEEKKLTVQPVLDGAKILVSLRNISEQIALTLDKRKSVIGKLPVLYKHLLFLLLFTASLAVRSVLLCAALFAVSLAYAGFASYPVKKLVVSLLKVIPLLLFFCVFQMIFYPAVPGETIYVPWRYFMITPSKIRLCIETLLHTEAALTCIVSFVYTTSEYELIDGFSLLLKPLTVLHLPVRYAVVILEMIFRFVPLLVDEASGIIKTQLVRGGLGKSKNRFSRVYALLPLFIPLIIQTIKRSEALADALTERCFS